MELISHPYKKHFSGPIHLSLNFLAFISLKFCNSIFDHDFIGMSLLRAEEAIADDDHKLEREFFLVILTENLR